MGLFDYALNNFMPYQGGLLGSLGNNDMAALARTYGGYQPTQDDPGFETAPAAVVDVGGLKMVDYGAATERAAEMGAK